MIYIEIVIVTRNVNRGQNPYSTQYYRAPNNVGCGGSSGGGGGRGGITDYKTTSYFSLI